MMSDPNHLAFTVDEPEKGERLDRLFSLRFPDTSRSRFKDLS